MNYNYVLSNNLVIDSSVSLDATIINALDQVHLLVQQRLQAFAHQPEFTEKMGLAFGIGVEVDFLRTAWLAGDYSIFPVIEIRNTEELNGANGAFSTETGRIYLAQEFISNNIDNLELAVNVLLEEIGHKVDDVLNNTDSAGDEGAIFLALVQGESLSEEVLQK
ncbi:hypothetical protein WJM97_09350 [Okeanomitos corallinicola TIOX110]|uniref:Uncharacterized protein n=1 Tax=Okeanomitos corallinicola TIOX110 TaxID=3133117 RepID=A0ABZ2UXQ1_9CYAN